MTERPGRRASWTAALVVAPSAAALFGASTAWALHRTPAPAAAAVRPVAAPPRPSPTRTSPVVRALQRTAAYNNQQLVAMTAQLRALRAEVTAVSVLPAAGAATYAVTGRTAGTGYPSAATPPRRSTSSGSAAGARPAPAAAPAQPAAAAPAPPPPPVNATTGASK